MGLLRGMGYRNVRHYAGGIADWTDHGGAVEEGPVSSPAVVAASPAPAGAPVRRRSAGAAPGFLAGLVDRLGDWSIARLLGIWIGMTVGMGVVYWAWDVLTGDGLRVGSVPLSFRWQDLLTDVYFSFVTALSIGYGDVTPVGPVRILAILEGAAGLLLFGCVISKLVSRRQEDLTREIHRLAFEGRLERVRTNLHFLRGDLQAIAALCADQAASPVRVLARLESATTVFAGELQAIHDLLYRPQQIPDERVLESILVNLAEALREIGELLACLEAARERSPVLRATLRSLSTMAGEICGECVPREYAPDMRAWMDRIQDLARRIA